MKRRVVITGAGVISSIGIGVDEFWRNCLLAKAMVAPIPAHWNSYSDLTSNLWSPLPEINPETLGIARTERLQLDPVAVLALGSARDALENAGLHPVPLKGSSHTFSLPGVNSARAGVYLGTGLGGATTFLQNHTYHLLRKPRSELADYAEKTAATGDQMIMENILALMNHGRRFNPFEVSMVMPNAPSAAIGIKYSLTGPNSTFSVACASGTVAIGNAYRSVQEGRVDIAVTGGCEYFADEWGHIFRSFDVSGTLVRDCSDPKSANRPFDENRSGFLFSEGGAAVLVVEELEHARRRGARVMAELIGFSETFDAYSIMRLAPGGEQMERLLRGALSDADVTTHDVSYINAHGTGTKNNDEVESDVISRVFGKSVRVNSTKSLVGHTIGASGAIEALVAALSLRDQTTHVCKNLSTPVRDLNFVRTVEPFDMRVAVSQSFAFGGHNAALVLRRFDKSTPGA